MLTTVKPDGTRRRKVSPKRKPVWRLDMDCGHTAFAIPGEEHEQGRRRPCRSCGEGVWSLIVKVTPSKEKP